MRNPLPIIAILIIIAFLVAAPIIFRGGAAGPQAELPANGLPTFLEFNSKACGICKMMKPGIDRLEREFGENMNFVYLDVNDRRSDKLTSQFDVYNLPTIVILSPGGKELGSFEGQAAIPALREAIRAALVGGGKGSIYGRANMIRAMLDEYEATGETENLNRAREAVDAAIKAFGDDSGGFFDTAKGGTAAGGDKPLPGNAMMASNLIRIYYCAGGEKYKELAEKTLKTLPPPESSGALGASLAVTSYLVRHFPLKIVIVGDKKAEVTKALRKEALGFYEPRKIILTLDPKEDAERLAELPYVARNEPVLYACVETACSMPVTDPANVEPQLRRFVDKFLKKER